MSLKFAREDRRKMQSVYDKISKPVQVGDMVFKSQTEAGLFLKCAGCTVKKYIKLGRKLNGYTVKRITRDEYLQKKGDR